MNNKHTVFVTGVTGLVGSYLLKILLEKKYKVYALARRNYNESASTRVKKMLYFWSQTLLTRERHNLVVLEGDVTKHNLGLNKKIIKKLNGEVGYIFHCAALTNFNISKAVTTEVNVQGAKNVFCLGLEWFKNGRLQKVAHISTAYLCGNYQGKFNERDLDLKQKFSTSYEESKFNAEKIAVYFRKKGLPIDVFRPPIILGEKSTGKIIKFNSAFYQALRIWNLNLFDYFPSISKTRFNFVFVDEFCKSMLLIFFNSKIKNRNYHTFSSLPSSLFKVVDSCSRIFNFKKPHFVSSREFFTKKSTYVQRRLIEHNFYFINRRVLDSRATNKLLNRYNFMYSGFDNDSLGYLIKYCIQRGFLKILQ